MSRPRIRNRGDLERISPKQRKARASSLTAISLMRAEPQRSLTEASRRVGTTPRTIQEYAGEALERRGVRWEVTEADRLYRAMFVVSGGQLVPADVRGSRMATEISAHYQAIGHYLGTGDDGPLQQFAGRTVAGVEYETDPDVIDEMARRGQLDLESIYQFLP